MFTVIGLVATAAPALAKSPGTAPPPPGLRAGVGVADLSWHVGASAGQYATDGVGPGSDPSFESVKQAPSYGVQSRLTARALVLEDAGGQRVALVKVDNYLAQDLLTRRVAQLLEQQHVAIPRDRIILSATHDHSSPYYNTPSAGVWVFQDVWDVRAFEYQARQVASASPTPWPGWCRRGWVAPPSASTASRATSRAEVDRPTVRRTAIPTRSATTASWCSASMTSLGRSRS